MRETEPRSFPGVGSNVECSVIGDSANVGPPLEVVFTDLLVSGDVAGSVLELDRTARASLGLASLSHKKNPQGLG